MSIVSPATALTSWQWRWPECPDWRRASKTTALTSCETRCNDHFSLAVTLLSHPHPGRRKPLTCAKPSFQTGRPPPAFAPAFRLHMQSWQITRMKWILLVLPGILVNSPKNPSPASFSCCCCGKCDVCSAVAGCHSLCRKSTKWIVTILKIPLWVEIKIYLQLHLKYPVWIQNLGNRSAFVWLFSGAQAGARTITRKTAVQLFWTRFAVSDAAWLPLLSPQVRGSAGVLDRVWLTRARAYCGSEG